MWCVTIFFALKKKNIFSLINLGIVQCLEIIYFKDWFWICVLVSYRFSIWFSFLFSSLFCPFRAHIQPLIQHRSLRKWAWRLEAEVFSRKQRQVNHNFLPISCFLGPTETIRRGPKPLMCFPRLLLVAVEEVIDGLRMAPPWLHQSGVITPVCGIQIKSAHSGSFAPPVEKSLKN